MDAKHQESEEIKQLRRACNALYLEVPEMVANDVKRIANEAIDYFQSQLSLSEGRVKELEAKLKSYQAYEDNINQALNSGDGVYRP